MDNYAYTIHINGVDHIMRETGPRIHPGPAITEFKTPFWRWVYYQIVNIWR